MLHLLLSLSSAPSYRVSLMESEEEGNVMDYTLTHFPDSCLITQYQYPCPTIKIKNCPWYRHMIGRPYFLEYVMGMKFFYETYEQPCMMSRQKLVLKVEVVVANHLLYLCQLLGVEI